MESYSFQRPPSYLDDLIYPHSAFSRWQEVPERGALMKHSNAAAGWRWLSPHNECETVKSVATETLLFHSSLIFQKILPLVNIFQHFLSKFLVSTSPLQLFSGPLNTCLKSTDLFLRQWRQHVLCCLFSPWKRLFASWINLKYDFDIGELRLSFFLEEKQKS